MLLTSHTDGESGDVRHAGRRDKRPTGHLTPVPIELIVQRLPLQLLKLTWKKIAEAGSRARNLEWNGVTTGNGIGKWAWRSSDPRYCVKTLSLLSLWFAHLFNAFVGYEGVAVSQAVPI